MCSNSGNSSVLATSAIRASAHTRKSPIASAASVRLSASTSICLAERVSTRAFRVRTEYRVTHSSRRRGARLGSCAEYKYGLHDFLIGVMLIGETFEGSGKQTACDFCDEGASAIAHATASGQIVGTDDRTVVGD